MKNFPPKRLLLKRTPNGICCRGKTRPTPFSKAARQIEQQQEEEEEEKEEEEDDSRIERERDR